MTKPDDEADEVVLLVEACLDAREQGGESGVDDLLRKHPQQSSAVRKRLQLLASAGLLDDVASTGEDFPEYLGDFHLLELLGKGGMGVVYRARQLSLDRDVAIKLIAQGQLYFPGARDRFQREVEVVAKLNHVGIVAIHAVGEDHGIPYYAMEFVDGVSLDQLLASLGTRRVEKLSAADLNAQPASGAAASMAAAGAREEDPRRQSWVNACFSLAVKIGEALEHAHSRGVLHRDIKPSNIMLTPSGEPRLLDFGLAWFEGATRLTRSGAQMGSLPYMAPEQVRGDADEIGVQTDVYALGVTLYELLTLRSPHWSESTERTRTRILEGRPLPIERLNNNAPWDAVTVIQSAMSLEAKGRYPTMQAMVDDMRRYLQHRPIQARRPSLGLRARRWVQRVPGRAVAVLLATIMIVGGPVGYAALTQAASEDLRQAYLKESQERLRAEQLLEDAVSAIDAILREGRDRTFAERPGADPSRKRLLEQALKLYQRLLAREIGNKKIVAGVIEAATQVSSIQRELGNAAEALAAAQRALQLLGELDESSDERLLVLHSEATYAQLLALYKLGKHAEFESSLSQQVGHAGGQTSGLFEFSTRQMVAVLQLQAQIQQSEGDVSASLLTLREAITLCEDQIELHGEEAKLDSELAGCLQTKAYIEGFHQPSANYVGEFVRAKQLLEDAIERNGATSYYRHQLAELSSSWAHVEILHRRNTEAVTRAQDASELFSQLVMEFPQREHFSEGYLKNFQRLSWAFRRGGDLERALDELEAGVEFGAAARERMPKSQPVLLILGMLLSELSHHTSAKGDLERAAELWPQARECWESLLASPDAPISARIQAGTFFDNLARHQLSTGTVDDAQKSALEALEWHRKMLARTGGQEHAKRIATTLPLLVSIQIKLGQLELAATTLREGILHGELDPSLLETPDFAEGLGERLSELVAEFADQ